MGCHIEHFKEFILRWPGPDNAIAYTGYTYDHFAELYYAQARYYLPGTGRFISQDPWQGDLTLPGTLNPYLYVLNNPLKYVDPLGLEPLLDGGVSELTRQQRKVYTPATNSRGAETNSWSCPIVKDIQRGLQQAGSGFVTGIRQVNRENLLQSYNVAKEYLPEGAKIYVIEGHIGQENYYILTDGQISSEDVLAAVGAGAGVIFTIAPGGKVSGKVLGKLSKGAGKADFIVTPHGEVLPATKGALQENLKKMTQQGGKYYGNDSKGPLRVRMEKAHPEDPNYIGPKNPDHTVDHIHIERRKNVTSGPWGSNKTTIPQSFLNDELWLP